MKMHHIGYCVKDIEKSRKKYEALGFAVSKRVGNQGIQPDEKRNIKILFLENGEDECMIELVERLDTEKASPLDFILKTHGQKRNYSESIPYHICYEVEDIDKAERQLRRQHFVVITPKEPTTEVLFGKNVTFLFHKATGIIELIEK